jgi:hypothetical protein
MERGTLSLSLSLSLSYVEEERYKRRRQGEIMRVLLESGARQNYNLGDVIPLRRNGLHIPRGGDEDGVLDEGDK